MKTRFLPILAIVLLAFVSVFVNSPPVQASCPSTCSNSTTATFTVGKAQPASSFNLVASGAFNVPFVGDFGVLGISCVAGDTANSASFLDSQGNTWSRVSSLTAGSAGNNPVVTQVYTTSITTGGADTITVSLVQSGNCIAQAATWDTLAKIWAESPSNSAVYVCTGGAAANNPCADNLQTYTNTVSDSGTSVLMVNFPFVNSSSAAPFLSASGSPDGWLSTGSGQSMQTSCNSAVSTLFDSWGATCEQPFMAWAWKGTLAGGYTSGATLNAGKNNGNGANCSKGNGQKCFLQVGVVTAVFSNVAQVLVTIVSPPSISSINYWFFPLLFLGMYDALYFTQGILAKVSTKGLIYLMLGGFVMGTMIGLLMGILGIQMVILSILALGVWFWRFK